MDTKTKAVLAVAVIAIVVVAAAAVLLMNDNNNGGGEKVNYMKDPNYNIVVMDGNFPAGSALETSILSGAERDSAVNKVPDKVIDRDSAVVYKILAKCNGKEVQPEKETQIEIIMKSLFKEDTNVSYISGDSAVQLYSFKNNNELRFHSNYLGTFVIAKVAATTNMVSVSCQNATVSVNGASPVSSYAASFAKGASVTAVAAPNDGFEFEGYYINGSKVSGSATYTFTVGDSDMTISAVAKKAAAKLVIDGGNSTLYVNGENVGKTYSRAVEPGTAMTVYAVADKGYTVTGMSGTYASSTPVNTFTFTGEASISVQTQAASKGTSQVEVTASLKGAVSDSFGSIIAFGQDVGDHYVVTLQQTGPSMQLSAEPKAGYSFDHWTIDGQEYVGKAMTVTAGSEDMKIDAVFVEAPAHMLTATIDNGTVKIDGGDTGSKSVREGLQAVVKAVPAEGYRFVGWYLGDKCVSVTDEYAVTMGDSDVSFEARTQSTVINVELSVTDGTIEVNGTNVGTSFKGVISAGDTIVFEALADEGYVFSTWNMNGTVYNANKITVKGASEDIAAVATMVKAVARTVSVSTDYGSVSIDGVPYGKAGSAKAYDGKDMTISVDVPYGYMLRGWSYNDKWVSTEESFSFKVSGDMSFKAVAESTLHTLVVKAVNGGLIIDSANVGSEYTTQLYTGESLIVNAAPSAGNTFSEWDVNGKKYGASYQTIEIRMGSEDIVATAHNVPMADGTLHITAVNGTVKVGDSDVGDSHDIKASVGEVFKLTAVPSAGYRFDHWMLDGERSEFQIVSVTMGTEHVNAEAIMVKNETHTVAVSIDHGNLFYNGVNMGSRMSVSVEDKSVLTIKAQPLAGYALAGWYDGDSFVTIGSDYEFQANSDVSLTVRTVVSA
ncbi:MAG: InlB B-repeat-containing protein [Candidatus Methanomethylophilaceae archaeon]|nr:InlB B-repeat-containing protein [Candidatus Methanomethylophilaceae archaeon]